MSDLKLFYFPLSSCSRKILIALFEKGITFDSVIIHLPKGEQKLPWYLAINPNGKVPVLKYKDHYLYDSSVILEFLEDNFPDKPLLPADPLERAIIRKHTQYADQYFYPYISGILAELRKPEKEQNLRAINVLLKCFTTTYLPYLEELVDVKENVFICGKLSFADLAFAPGLINLKNLVGDRLPLNSKIQAWLKSFQELDSYQSCLNYGVVENE
jgi:glutathione S-transferase